MSAINYLPLVEREAPAVAEKPARARRDFYKPGHYADLSNAEYHGSFGYGSTTIKKLGDMPFAKMDYQRRNPSPPSDAMQLGSAVHVMAMEPHKIEEEIAIMPVLNLRTKEGRAAKQYFIAENESKLILTAESFAKAGLMAKSLREHPQIGLYFEEGHAEQSVYQWYNPEDWDQQNDYRIMCKVRPDWIIPGHSVIFDLKTTRDAAESEFAKQIVKMGYDFSAAMYLDTANRCREFLDFCQVEAFLNFVWICVENEPPYLATSYSMTDATREKGENKYHSTMRKLHQYKMSSWKGYGSFNGREFVPDTRPIDTPNWGNKIV